MSVVERAKPSSRLATWALALCAALAGCSDPCEHECAYDAWRCDGSEVELCAANSAASCEGSVPTYWSRVEACGSGTHCTTLGCSGPHAACCAPNP